MDIKIGVIGLGYVGLPVASEFAKVFPTLGFDINEARIGELKKGLDHNGQVKTKVLKNSNLTFSSQLKDLKQANFFIVTVPTPLDGSKRPDLRPLLKAAKIVASVLKKDDTVVFESTVYPGATEEECLPLLEKVSGLKAPEDFKVGYCPERINPGDEEHSFTKITKVVSGQDARALELITYVYEGVVKAGVFKAASIKIAEAAKVIENTQRDLNIALMNELALIFEKLNLDTKSVLETAATKWNFNPYQPGLVGGHCIGVDPYYLTHKAESIGFKPEVILAGRHINDGMGKFIAQKTIKEMIRQGIHVSKAKISLLGITFKENCPDTRNTRSIDIYHELNNHKIPLQVCDPWANPAEVQKEHQLRLTNLDKLEKADAVIFAVAHEEFKILSPSNLKQILKPKAVLIDIKGIFNDKFINSLGYSYWRL